LGLSLNEGDKDAQGHEALEKGKDAIETEETREETVSEGDGTRFMGVS
jgi:hypothetical protein